LRTKEKQGGLAEFQSGFISGVLSTTESKGKENHKYREAGCVFALRDQSLMTSPLTEHILPLLWALNKKEWV
jgi:hypothetical protein